MLQQVLNTVPKQVRWCQGDSGGIKLKLSIGWFMGGRGRSGRNMEENWVDKEHFEGRRG